MYLAHVPVDVIVNKPFKYKVWRLFEEYLDSNLQAYLIKRQLAQEEFEWTDWLVQNDRKLIK